MPRTQLPSTLIGDETIVRADLNITTTGSAVIRRLIQGTGITISSTGVDTGTGDVTVSINSSSVVTSFNTRTGAVTLTSGDVTTALGFTPISGYTETDTLATVTGRGATTSTSLTLTGGALTLNNGTSNRISFGLNGVALPTFSSYSAGVKLVLYNSVQAADAGFTIGIANTNFFFTTGTTGSGYTFYGGTTAAMTISGTGNVVATGTLTGTSLFGSAVVVADVKSSGTNLDFRDNANTLTATVFDSTGNWVIQTGGTHIDLGYKLYVAGSIYSTSDIIAFSDARVKKNIRTIPGALSKVLSMRGVMYEPILHPGTGDRVGVIAQEVEAVLPELVNTDKNGMKGVMYQNTVGLLIEAIKEQNEKIKQLENLINALT